MATFGNREAAPMNSKPGEYILRVIGVEKSLSKGKKTSGEDLYALKCLLEQTGSIVRDCLIICDEDFCAARVDCFLKSTGQTLTEGQEFSFDEQEARENLWLFVNPLGLRGWARINYKPFTEEQAKKFAHLKPDEQDRMRYNEVMVWITNKEKLSRHIAPQEPTAGNPDWS